MRRQSILHHRTGWYRLLGICLVFGVAGVVFLARSQAATPVSSAEPERAITSGQTFNYIDASASNKAAVRFGGISKPADGSNDTWAYSNNKYYYVSGTQYAEATGASADMTIMRPHLSKDYTSGHSLMEIALESSDAKEIIEIGWNVDSSLYGDLEPHLFIYHWDNGNGSCYNGCGYVSIDKTVNPGDWLTPFTVATFGMTFTNNRWEFQLNGKSFGYMPLSQFPSQRFDHFSLVQIFGEVYAADSQTCTQMGNGLPGSMQTAAAVRNYKLAGSSTAAAFAQFETQNSGYTYGQATGTGYNLGGPGSCSATKKPAEAGAHGQFQANPGLVVPPGRPSPIR